MLRPLLWSWTAAKRFGTYRTRPVTFGLAYRWFMQFTPAERSVLNKLLKAVDYLDEEMTVRLLVAANNRLLKRLKDDGVLYNSIIYVQFDDAGSSSAAVLNLLRDRARLENLGVHFRDSKDVKGLNDLSNELENGAVIYVDDFIGSGTQFRDAHNVVGPCLIGNFSEHLLAVCVCEEAIHRLKNSSVEIVTEKRHLKKDRPLLDDCPAFSLEERGVLRRLCKKMDPMGCDGLGYLNMATMVVLYRNTPDNGPLVLRGCQSQQPIFGLLPRTTDFKGSPLPLNSFN